MVLILLSDIEPSPILIIEFRIFMRGLWSENGRNGYKTLYDPKYNIIIII